MQGEKALGKGAATLQHCKKHSTFRDTFFTWIAPFATCIYRADLSDGGRKKADWSYIETLTKRRPQDHRSQSHNTLSNEAPFSTRPNIVFI